MNKNWANHLNRHLSKEDIQIVNIYMKICSTSLDIRGMWIKTIVSCHFLPTRIEVFKKNKGGNIISVSENVDKWEPPYIDDANV